MQYNPYNPFPCTDVYICVNLLNNPLYKILEEYGAKVLFVLYDRLIDRFIICVIKSNSKIADYEKRIYDKYGISIFIIELKELPSCAHLDIYRANRNN